MIECPIQRRSRGPDPHAEPGRLLRGAGAAQDGPAHRQRHRRLGRRRVPLARQGTLLPGTIRYHDMRSIGFQAYLKSVIAFAYTSN